MNTPSNIKEVCALAMDYQQIIIITGAIWGSVCPNKPLEEHKCEQQLSAQLCKEWLSSGKVQIKRHSLLNTHPHTHCRGAGSATLPVKCLESIISVM
ncbi:hypothetical protein AMEX_G4518 [Astyanax mexicanus]|uniref:Uncharacterized protein n=1 Tax=Astyanax mexicanus TaxID=7994 RepID=A0A8T2M789_ASTMX|nr:hypothetical protein AMEX_G4518 [Astyanax mexicanus]